ncbi:MAG: sugar phosphate isomerase/epimerase [Saprospiraceae bacterium]|nr:sugar phosphate isomerase/epimerase [Saprospiraceae bacterium]
MNYKRNGRRAFVKNTAGLATAMLVSPNAALCASIDVTSRQEDLHVNIFSKHLQFLDYKQMAEVAAEMGFDGIDLTVRPKGHVEPERVEEELPRAVAAIKDAGIRADMMVSRITDADTEVHRRVIKTAAAEGIRYYRMGYLSFHEDRSIPASLEAYHEAMIRLAEFNKSTGISGAYQNHAGMRVGAEMWDLYHLMKDIDPDLLGIQYDVRHAMVEGGTSWQNGLRLIEDQVTSIVLKDYLWKQIDGQWKVVNVPLGEGMVDWPSYFKLLKQKQIHVPVTIHYEYDLGGVEHGAHELHGMTQDEVLSKMKKDLELAKKLWREA